MARCIITAAALAFGACAPPGTPDTADTPVDPAIVWHCDNGVSFTARNTTNGNAEVVTGGRTYRLPGVIAGSGVRYFDGRVEYWEKGGEAMLNGASGGPYANCKS